MANAIPPEHHSDDGTARVICLAWGGTTVAATVVAFLGWVGLWVSVVPMVVCLAVFCLRSRVRPFAAVTVFAVLFVGLALLCLLTHPVVSAGPAARLLKCTTNLKRIGVAIENYHIAYGCYPPVCLLNERGDAMHSWRVLILPFLGEHRLHKQYRFSEPWNSDHNIQVAGTMPGVYACPSNGIHPTNQTSYMALITGDGLRRWAFLGGMEAASREVGERVQVVEVADSGVLWTQPEDVRLEEMADGRADLRERGALIISSNHRRRFDELCHAPGPHVLLENGVVRTLRQDLDQHTIAACLAGGESCLGRTCVYETRRRLDVSKAVAVAALSLGLTVTFGLVSWHVARGWNRPL